MRRCGWVFLLGSVITLSAGCLSRQAPPVLSKPQAARYAVVVDLAPGATAAPEAVVEGVAQQLAARNLMPQAVSPEALGSTRFTDERLAAMGQPPTLVLMVELRARFFNFIQGQYKWTVYGKVSWRGPDGVVGERGFDLPAVLRFEHQEELAAIAQVNGLIQQEVEAALDRLVRAAAKVQGAEAADTPVGAGPKLDGGSGGASQALSQAAGPGLIYFILVDRFANGDPTNDGSVSPGAAEGWHGGDLAGVIQHLDALAALGVDTLWLSPLTRSMQDQVGPTGAYHGYWVRDHHEVEPRFGTWETLRRLREEAAQRGIGLVLDLVMNHVGYEAPLRQERPEWFHQLGPITDWNDPVQRVRGDVHGLPDLAQEHPEVERYLLSSVRRWMGQVQPAGARLDAVVHVPVSFWQRLNGELAQQGAAIRLAEIYSGSLEEIDRTRREGNFTHAFDYPLYFALRDSWCAQAPAGGGPPPSLAKVAAVVSARPPSAASTLVTFLDNHDQPRAASLCGSLLEALTLMFALPGVPSITYGTEHGLAGEGLARQDWPGPPGDTPEAARIAQLTQLRAQSAALRQGWTRWLSAGRDHLSFVRGHGEEALWITARRPGAPPPDLPAHLDLQAEPVVEGLVSIYRLSGPVAPPAPQAVRLVLEGVPGAPAEVRLTGTGAAFGDWSPEGGVALHRGDDGRWAAGVTLREGDVIAVKPVYRQGDGWVWAPGGDRYLQAHGSERVLRWEGP